MTKLKFKPNKTQIIFFDLEFFVPEYDRGFDDNSLRANPYKNGHLLLGGTFIRKFPQKNNKNEIRKYWIWDYEDEKELLKDIYGLFLDSWRIIRGDEDQCDLIVSGIGVSRVDIGYLYSKCIEHSIDENEKLFEVFYQLRFIDLEQVALPYYKTCKNVLYPKNTADLLQKFKIDRKRESGRGVWDMYDNKRFEHIENRNYDEVLDFLIIYEKIMDRMKANNLSKKYSCKSIDKVITGLLSEDDKKVLLELIEYNSDEERYYIPENIDEKATVAKLFFKAGYWNREH